MKHLLHKLSSLRLLTLLAVLLGLGSGAAWADSYTITFKTGSNDNPSGYSTSTACSSIVSEGGTYLSGNLVTATKTYGPGTGGLKLGASSDAGVIKMNLASSVKPTSIVVNAKLYNSSKAATIALNGKTAQSLTASFANYSFSFDGKTDVSYIQLNSSKYCWVSSITVNYESAKTATALKLNKTVTTLTVNGDTETLTATVTPDGGDALVSPSITWTSSDKTVATVAAGVVTPLKGGTTTITATYAGDATYAESSNTCVVTVTDGRTAVNLSTFTATNATLIVGGTPNSTETSVTNDQGGWTVAYTYSSDNTSVATVDGNGVITAVAKGTATITASLNVDPSDATYKAGTTTSKTIEITVNNPSHAATFSVNGETTSNTFEEGASITFPSDPSAIDGKVFQGWVTEAIVGTQVAAPSFVSSPKMGKSDVTYYAVFADKITGVEGDASMTITNSTSNIPGSYSYSDCSLNGVTFRVEQIYNNNGKLQWKASAGTLYNKGTLSKIQSVVLTYDAADSKKNITLKIGDEANPSSGTSITPSISDNVYTFDCSSYNKDYFVLTNGTNAGYVTSIVINYKAVAPDTYENYCTTISNLPLAVVTLSTENITMTWGENGKTLTATAAVDDEPLDETITFTPSSPNLTIDGSGNISCDVPGDYTITASVAETLAHQAGQAVCNVTVNKKDIELAFENETVNMMLSVGEYAQTATATPDAYDGDIKYEITSSTSADAIIDEGTGELLFENTGIIVVTATAEEIALYNGNTATYTLYVKTTPDISVSDQNVAYGSTFTVDDSAIEGGDITVTSGSATIATVDGLVITPVAVGSTIITVRTAATETYTAGEATFTLTVNAPEAASTNTAENTVFYESFNSISGTGGRDGTFSGNVGTSALTNSDESWNTTTRCGGAYQCLKFGTTDDDATLTSNTISLSGNATLTFAGAGWYSGTMSLAVSATGATLTGDTNVTLTASTWKTYTIEITNATGSVTISFVGHRGFLDDIKITQPITSTTVTTTGGYATYCYQYPLDLDGISGAKAYRVSSLDKSKVILTQIYGTIKGGVPFILKSDADNASIEIPLADESDNVPGGNLLIGTLAPTFVEQTSGDYTNFAYSKSNGCFVKLGDDGNTVPANRAYLPINLGGGGGVKALTFDFGNATGINTVQGSGFKVQDSKIYNLAGQRVDGSRFKVNGSGLKTGIYIVNGKKVLVK